MNKLGKLQMAGSGTPPPPPPTNPPPVDPKD